MDGLPWGMDLWGGRTHFSEDSSEWMNSLRNVRQKAGVLLEDEAMQKEVQSLLGGFGALLLNESIQEENCISEMRRMVGKCMTVWDRGPGRFQVCWGLRARTTAAR